MISGLLRRGKDLVRLKGDEAAHEQTDAWSNRDLIPLPPSRRTWGLFEYFGYWTLSSLNIATWQKPNTFLTLSLSVGSSMMVIVVSRFIISTFVCFVAWCGMKWHIGFTIQNRYTWGMVGSYIPLLQRILLNFIWNAVQCWNGGKLISVCIVAIWPSFHSIKNTLPSNMPTTVYEMVGFTLFWVLSLPFLWIPPEKFRLPFQVISIYCGCGMLAMMIWSLSVARGVGPVFTAGQSNSSNSDWSFPWLVMQGLNTAIGGVAAGMTNGSDFSRYGKNRRSYIGGTALCLFGVGTLVSFVGLVTTAACQKIYGEIYWNPPDLLMVMMENGQGSSRARAGVFFLAAGFALTNMFENVCGNAVAGGIDLAGLFPRYINIRRGALITFFATWICMPWQLVNEAATFINVLSSFSVFLAPIMGIMVCDFFVLRKRVIKLSALYHAHSSYWYWHGINWRVIPAWIAGWAPTVGGLAVAAREGDKPRALLRLYYCSFFIGFGISFVVFYAINFFFPVDNLGEKDAVDYYGTFTAEEAARLGVVRSDDVLEAAVPAAAAAEKMDGREVVTEVKLGDKSSLHAVG